MTAFAILLVVHGLIHLVGVAKAISDVDLAHLPTPVQKYLRVAGVVGQPRVSNFRVRMHRRIRNGRQGRWMPLRAEQYNVIHPSARLFYLNASLFTIPVQGYHRYVGSSASMRVKLLPSCRPLRQRGPR